MLDWVSRETLVDVTINAIPTVILVFFVAVTVFTAPWGWDPLAETFAHLLTVVPIVTLVIATYYVARAVELDARRQ